MNHLALQTLSVLAEDGPRNTGPDFGKASPFGLLVIVLLLLGPIVLVWSMNRRLKNIPDSFDTDEAESGTGAAESGPAGEDGTRSQD